MLGFVREKSQSPNRDGSKLEVRTSRNDVAAGDLQRDVGNFSAEQDPTALDQHIGHDAAP